jgi:hypothetical protein
MIFPHTITLLKHTETESALGGINRTYQTVDTGTSYRCFFQPQQESLAIINESGGRNLIVNIYIEPAAPVEATDRLVFQSVTYEVTGVIQQFSPRGLSHCKATARVLDFVQ